MSVAYVDVEWHMFPKEEPFAFPGKTPFYVTIKNPFGSIYSQVVEWDHLTRKFSEDNVIAWAYIPRANAYIPKDLA